MVRRGRRRNRGRGRRRSGGNRFILTIPFVGSLGEKTSTDISFNNIFTGSTKATLQGVPWRIQKVVYSYANSGFKISSGTEISDPQPAFFQICLNNASTSNVEAISSRRHLSCEITQKGRLFPTSPNPWKEDEQRDQSIITVDNIVLGGGAANTVISYLLHVTFEFGSIPFTHPAGLLKRNYLYESTPSIVSLAD